jgi:hypothetical protein
LAIPRPDWMILNVTECSLTDSKHTGKDAGKQRAYSRARVGSFVVGSGGRILEGLRLSARRRPVATMSTRSVCTEDLEDRTERRRGQR